MDVRNMKMNCFFYLISMYRSQYTFYIVNHINLKDIENNQPPPGNRERFVDIFPKAFFIFRLIPRLHPS